MNYRHIFHAGNFADVFKHLILSLCMEKLQENKTPFFVIDTHSGIGKYDLSSDFANKTGEYKDGILKILDRKNPDKIFQNYLNIVRMFNRFNKGQTKTYPGSPQIIKQFLRDGDKLICSELHPQAFILLKRSFAGDKRIQTLNHDGYSLLQSNFPPHINRGLVFIDPPFEKGNGKKDDFEQILTHLKGAYKKFSTGIYLIWYPIVNEAQSQRFHKRIKDLKIPKLLIAQIIIDKNIKDSFKGCGMLIVNFPDQLDEKLSILTPLILQYLGKTNGEVGLEIIL
ncbi:MAG: 23S rRNA (adenine2030-N6)-methyltransferase [Rickettsiales bacterium]|jgi:23S rRNA (adenine2030-N6)-methyltransferase